MEWDDHEHPYMSHVISWILYDIIPLIHDQFPRYSHGQFLCEAL